MSLSTNSGTVKLKHAGGGPAMTARNTLYLRAPKSCSGVMASIFLNYLYKQAPLFLFNSKKSFVTSSGELAISFQAFSFSFHISSAAQDAVSSLPRRPRQRPSRTICKCVHTGQHDDAFHVQDHRSFPLSWRIYHVAFAFLLRLGCRHRKHQDECRAAGRLYQRRESQ